MPDADGGAFPAPLFHCAAQSPVAAAAHHGRQRLAAQPLLAQPHRHLLLQPVTQVQRRLGAKQRQVVENRRFVAQAAGQRHHFAGVDDQEALAVEQKIIQMQVQLPQAGPVEQEQAVEQITGERQTLLAAQGRLAGLAAHPLLDQHRAPFRALVADGLENQPRRGHASLHQGAVAGQLAGGFVGVAGKEQLGEHGGAAPAGAHRDTAAGQMTQHRLGAQRLTVDIQGKAAGPRPVQGGQLRPGERCVGGAGGHDRFPRRTKLARYRRR